MPRDLSGNYTLPPGNPVIPGTIIDADWANPTLEDIAVQLNGVVTRDGLLGPTQPFKIVAGTAGFPGLAFAVEPTTGIYRTGPGTWNLSILGVSAVQVTATGVSFVKPITYGDVVSLPDGSIAAPSLTFTGDTNTGLYHISPDVLGFVTAGAERMRITAAGFIGINTNNPLARLHVEGQVAFASGGTRSISFYPDEVSGPSQQFFGGATDWRVTLNVASDALTVLTGVNERLRITNTGLVGIGTVPTTILDVFGSYALIHNADYNGFIGSGTLLSGGGVTDFTIRSSAALTFGTSGGNLRMKIDANGLVVINGTTASQFLTVFGNSQLTGVPAGVHDTRTADGVNSTCVQFTRAAANVGSISTTNAATFFNTSSDARYKDNIVDAKSAIMKVCSLRVRSFSFKESPTTKVKYGFIAQEVNEVEPYAVMAGDNRNAWSIDHSKLVPILTKALQEVIDRVAALEELS